MPMPQVQAETFEECLKLLETHEVSHGVKYVRMNGNMRKVSKNPTLQDLRKLRVVCIDGTLAGVRLGTAKLSCQHGHDHHGRDKDKYRQSKELKAAHSYEKKNRTYIQDSWKLGCSAEVTITHHVIIDGYKISGFVGNTERQRRGNMLKAAGRAFVGESGQLTHRFQLTFPEDNDHQNHPVDKHFGYQPMDERLRERVAYIVNHLFVTSTKQVAKHLEDFVDTLFNGSPPHRSNRRFFPTPKDLKNAIDAVIAATHTHTDDQDNLEDRLSRLDPSHHRVLQKCQGDSESLTFIHQTTEQQRLLRIYGNDLCLLDATHKTTRYGLPLFFVVVKTNVNYQIAASFIVSEETHDQISKALSILKSWNSSWKPKHWMVDCCTAEITAVESVFPGSAALIYDFHRLQAWNRWLVKGTNNIDKDAQLEIKKLLNTIATSTTEELYNTHLLQLWASDEWKGNTNLQNYLNQTWFSGDMHKRWVRCYRTNRVLRSVRTNNGIEAINRVVKSTIVHGTRAPTVTATVVKLLRWLETHHANYLDLNRKCSGTTRRYASNIPTTLHNRPHNFVSHVMTRLDDAKQLMEEEDSYKVELGEHPTCECPDFIRHTFPCKHIIKHWLNPEGVLRIPTNLAVNSWITLDSGAELNELNYPLHPTCQSPTYTPTSTPSTPPPSEKDIEEQSLVSSLSAIRSVCDQIKSWTYNCVDNTTAAEVMRKISAIQEECLGVKTQGNLPLRPSRSQEANSTQRGRRIIRSGALKRKKKIPLKYRRRKTGVSTVETVETLSECMEKEEIEEMQSEKTVKRLRQNPSHRMLEPGYWLTDDDMELTINLIRHQWPSIIAQAPCYIQRPTGFDCALPGKYVQILHANRNHWLAISNIGSSTFVRMFDSLAYDLDYEAFRGIASLHKTQAPHLRLRWEAVQRQEGASDCGLFTIAYLTDLLYGTNPTKMHVKITYDQKNLRAHLYKCLDYGQLTPFPRSAETNRRRIQSRYITLKVFCICRLPWNHTDGEEGVECDICHDFYHATCIGKEGCFSGRKRVMYTCAACADCLQ